MKAFAFVLLLIAADCFAVRICRDRNDVELLSVPFTGDLTEFGASFQSVSSTWGTSISRQTIENGMKFQLDDRYFRETKIDIIFKLENQILSIKANVRNSSSLEARNITATYVEEDRRYLIKVYTFWKNPLSSRRAFAVQERSLWVNMNNRPVVEEVVDQVVGINRLNVVQRKDIDRETLHRIEKDLKALEQTDMKACPICLLGADDEATADGNTVAIRSDESSTNAPFYFFHEDCLGGTFDAQFRQGISPYKNPVSSTDVKTVYVYGKTRINHGCRQ